jgi:hypothetical protein
MKRSSKFVSVLRGSTQKALQDTAAGCRELAAADLARAVLMDTANGRRRLETSANSWTTRAELIQRMDASFETRNAVARAEWEDGEAVSVERRDPSVGNAS